MSSLLDAAQGIVVKYMVKTYVFAATLYNSKLADTSKVGLEDLRFLLVVFSITYNMAINLFQFKS